MKQASRIIFYLYLAVVVLDLVFIYWFRDEWRWFTKPLLMPLLATGFLLRIQKPVKSNSLLILSAIFFSWVGDILLQARDLFIPGLISFLLAHVFYIIYFLKSGGSKKGWVQKHPLYVFPVAIYILILLYFLFPYLGSLAIPVVIYSLTIGLMLLLAINSRSRVDRKASALFTAGALSFVISDSVLAIHLFALNISLLGLIVMITYALAQWLIVKGALVQLESE